jgi:Na+-transporting methylmalonyl-CoA/oxaloacetate decarboxylase gamma subunit
MKTMSEYRRNYTDMEFVKKTYRSAPTPVPAPKPERDHDGEIVRQAIAMAVEEKRQKIAAESQRQANIRKLWSQLSGVPESEVDRLYGQQ